MERKLIESLKPYMRKYGYDQKYEWDKIALRYMARCKKILDVGCGEGRFIAHSPERISGVDHNEKSVAICREKGFSVKLGKVTALPFEDASFDAVHCSHVIEHLYPDDAYLLLKELNRVVRKGGLICIRAPLLYDGFYDDFTHIKPYNPEAILHYLKTDKMKQRTLGDIDGFFKVVKLKIRRQQLFFWLVKTPLWFLAVPFNMLQRLGIHSWKRTGYMLLLQKK